MIDLIDFLMDFVFIVNASLIKNHYDEKIENKVNVRSMALVVKSVRKDSILVN